MVQRNLPHLNDWLGKGLIGNSACVCNAGNLNVTDKVYENER